MIRDLRCGVCAGNKRCSKCGAIVRINRVLWLGTAYRLAAEGATLCVSSMTRISNLRGYVVCGGNMSLMSRMPSPLFIQSIEVISRGKLDQGFAWSPLSRLGTGGLPGVRWSPARRTAVLTDMYAVGRGSGYWSWLWVK